MQDEEKYAVEPKVAASGSSEDDSPAYGAATTASSSGKGNGLLAKLRGFEDALDRKIGVETHGIERRRPEDRDPTYASWSNQAVMFLMWMSATTNLSCFTTGFLGWELGLDLWRSIVIIIFSTFIGAAVTVRLIITLYVTEKTRNNQKQRHKKKKGLTRTFTGLVRNHGSGNRSSPGFHLSLLHGLVAGQSHRRPQCD